MTSFRKPRRGTSSITFNNVPQVIHEKVRSIGKPTRAVQVTKSRILNNCNTKETSKPVITNSKRNLLRKRYEDIAVNTILTGKELLCSTSKSRKQYSKEIQTLTVFTVDSCTQYTELCKYKITKPIEGNIELNKKNVYQKRWALSQHPPTGPDF